MKGKTVVTCYEKAELPCPKLLCVIAGDVEKSEKNLRHSFLAAIGDPRRSHFDFSVSADQELVIRAVNLKISKGET